MKITIDVASSGAGFEIDKKIAEAIAKNLNCKVLVLADKNFTLEDRVKKSNFNKSDLLISITSEVITNLNGIVTFVEAPISSNPRNLDLASKLHLAVVNSVKTCDNGIKGRYGYMFKNSKCPVIEIQLANIDNEDEKKAISLDSTIQTLAKNFALVLNK